MPGQTGLCSWPIRAGGMYAHVWRPQALVCGHAPESPVALSAQAPRQTFRTATRLVEVSVVVDRSRQASLSTDLTSATISPLVGRPRSDSRSASSRSLTLRAAPVSLPIAPPAGRSRGPSRNQLERPRTARPRLILFDRLNAGVRQPVVRPQACRAAIWRRSRPGDRVGALSPRWPAASASRFHDRSRRRFGRALDQYTATAMRAHYDASNEAADAIYPADGIAVWLADPSGNIAEFFAGAALLARRLTPFARSRVISSGSSPDERASCGCPKPS